MTHDDDTSRGPGLSRRDIARQRLSQLTLTPDDPTAECLTPQEVESAVVFNVLPEARQRHAVTCMWCGPLLHAARPDEQQKNAFAQAASTAWARAADLTGATDEITRAIAELEDHPERRLDLRVFIDSLGPRIARDREFPRHLIEAAHRAQWPTWAVQCLPSLFVRDEPRPGERGRALVWRYLLDCVDPEHDSITRELCGGSVFEVEVSSEIMLLLDRLAPTFEACRLRRPYASLTSLTGDVIHLVDGLRASDKVRRVLTERIVRALSRASLSVV